MAPWGPQRWILKAKSNKCSAAKGTARSIDVRICHDRSVHIEPRPIHFAREWFRPVWAIALSVHLVLSYLAYLHACLVACLCVCTFFCCAQPDRQTQACMHTHMNTRMHAMFWLTHSPGLKCTYAHTHAHIYTCTHTRSHALTDGLVPKGCATAKL